ncbi:hypothetical protein H5P28_11940 [Ruficoccus amylovorans]|uniref:Alpha-L-arabinofuranosidase 1 catalytic domain-containing protein n=1 Tax=Ruficoccus amylovorans TaxID=1804625 RepID=A0A842HG10_9BACT|nr:hypothetical protein [Ruficoccus amylovorans]MBC2594968.1 hypothetical protein [Ruficoccus amylovorans]
MTALGRLCALGFSLLAMVAACSGAEAKDRVSPYAVGINLSYFNDLDAIWENYGIPEKLERMGVRVLRYPGGEETSRWHWDQPGVNGYVDVWNPNHLKQNWQSTWFPQEQWAQNEAFMDVDEYFAYCEQLGTEPLLGINMSAGEVNKRREDGIAQAVALIEYVREKGYPLTYVYLDNEPWHKHSSNYYLFPKDDYAELCVLYAEAMRAVDPDLKFIANAFEAGSARNANEVRRFLDIAGDDVDVIELHYYWEWGRSTWEMWISQQPMLNSSQWRAPKQTKTFSEDLDALRKLIHDYGYPQIDLAVLEWNIAPAKSGEVPPTPRQTALMQSEMLMQFLDSGVLMTAIWPTFWQVTPPEGDANPQATVSDVSFRSIFEARPPYATTPVYDMFCLFAGVPGSRLLESVFEQPGIYRQTYLLDDGTSLVLVLNKSGQPQPLALEGFAGRTSRFAQISLEERKSGAVDPSKGLVLPGYSLTRVEIAPGAR